MKQIISIILVCSAFSGCTKNVSAELPFVMPPELKDCKIFYLERESVDDRMPLRITVTRCGSQTTTAHTNGKQIDTTTLIDGK